MKMHAILLSVVCAAFWMTGCATTREGSARQIIAVNCGGGVVEAGGTTWAADRMVGGGATWGAVGGKTVQQEALAIEKTDMPALYQSERYSMDAYRFTVPNGTYGLVLHFAETYEGITGPGQREFGVTANGVPVAEALDPMKEAGAFATPVLLKVAGVEVTDETLTIQFTPGVENPQINAIQILAE